MSRRNKFHVNADQSRTLVTYGLEGIEVEMAGLDRANGVNHENSMEYRCVKCGHGLDQQTVDGDRIYASLKDGDVECMRGGRHDMERLPLAWVNSAGLEFNEADDSIKLTVSVGDPRGAFVMQVRRIVDEDGQEVILLHVPHPSDPTPHMELKEHHPGTFTLG